MPYVITIKVNGRVFVAPNDTGYTTDLEEADVYQDLQSARDKFLPYIAETIIIYDEALAFTVLEA